MKKYKCDGPYPVILPPEHKGIAPTVEDILNTQAKEGWELETIIPGFAFTITPKVISKQNNPMQLPALMLLLSRDEINNN